MKSKGAFLRRAAVLVAALTTLVAVALVPSGQAQEVDAPDWAGILPLNAQVLQLSDPQSTQEELPGLGHKFELIGPMFQDSDPENPTGKPGNAGGGGGGNEVISSMVAPAGPLAFAFRNLPPGIKIMALTNQINLKYYFVAPKTCQAGSPRVTLLVDANGDGEFTQPPDFAAHGHLNPPTHAACVMNKWITEDLTDDLGRWEVTPGGAVPGIPVFPFTPWKAFAAAVTTAFPNHKVLAGFLIDGESCSFGFGPNNCGRAFYDLFTLENRTLEIWQDTVKNG